MKNILLTNDDGIRAPALEILREKMSHLGKVTIVAPEIAQNAMGNSLTLHKPVRINRLEENKYYVSGTPADCVRMGVLTILDDKVDLVVSGINMGANLGDDVGYSGTVAGAREGSLLGVPSLASSLVLNGKNNFEQAADITVKVAEKLIEKGLPERKVLNLNVPDLEDGRVKGIMVAGLGVRIYDREVRERTDPAGGKYYWIIGEELDGVADAGTDFEAIAKGYASLTPLTMDYTDYSFFEELKNWDLN